MLARSRRASVRARSLYPTPTSRDDVYSAGFGRVNRTVWHRSTSVGVRFCREERGG